MPVPDYHPPISEGSKLWRQAIGALIGALVVWLLFGSQ